MNSVSGQRNQEDNMPIYVYQCPSCNKVVEKLRRMADMDKPLCCAECEFLGEDETPMKRIPAASNYAFKKGWIPTNEGWQRGDM